jgi:hypothetical protein
VSELVPMAVLSWHDAAALPARAAVGMHSQRVLLRVEATMTAYPPRVDTSECHCRVGHRWVRDDYRYRCVDCHHTYNAPWYDDGHACFLGRPPCPARTVRAQGER